MNPRRAPLVSDWECEHGNLDSCPFCHLCEHGLPYMFGNAAYFPTPGCAPCARSMESLALWAELLDEA